MKAERIFETVLYADDLEAAKEFYTKVLGLDCLGASDLLVVFRLEAGVLLIFDADRSSVPGREVPSHGVRGEGHLAFAATDTDIDRWQKHFSQMGIPVESIVEWDGGGRSLYFRDPAGNSLEFAPPTLWGGNWNFGQLDDEDR